MADVLLHQQSFDYALSRSATEVIDWYPSPVSRSENGSVAPTTAGTNSPAEPQSTGPSGGYYDSGMSAAAALFRQLPSWHLFISSFGSDTIAERWLCNKGVSLRYGVYGSVLTSSKGYDTAQGGAGSASSWWNRVRPVLQLRVSARWLDGSKSIGSRITFQDLKSRAAVDVMFGIGRRVLIYSPPATESGLGNQSSKRMSHASALSTHPPHLRTQHVYSQFVRFDNKVLTSYTLVNVIDKPDSFFLRKGRVGVGVVLRTRPLGVNVFWGLCVEMLKSLVLLIHIDVLRRACLSVMSTNVFGSGVDVAMRLRVNAISFHRTILDLGLAFPFLLCEDKLQCCWRASINLGGLSIGGSIDDCTFGDLLLHSGQALQKTAKPQWYTNMVNKGKEFCLSFELLKPLANFSLSGCLVRMGCDPTFQSVRIHVAGGINVRHPNLSNYTNPFSSSYLYYNGNGARGEGGVSTQSGRTSSGFFDAMRKPSSMHGFFSITFS